MELQKAISHRGTKIAQWGGSSAIRLSILELSAANLKVGDALTISTYIDENSNPIIILRKEQSDSSSLEKQTAGLSKLLSYTDRESSFTDEEMASWIEEGRSEHA